METSWPPSAEARRRQLKVRLSETEYHTLTKHADNADLSISELVRLTLPLEATRRPLERTAYQARAMEPLCMAQRSSTKPLRSRSDRTSLGYGRSSDALRETRRPSLSLGQLREAVAGAPQPRCPTSSPSTSSAWRLVRLFPSPATDGPVRTADPEAATAFWIIEAGLSIALDDDETFSRYLVLTSPSR